MCHVRTTWLTMGVWVCLSAWVQAAWENKVLASDLRAPRGVTLQPDTQHVFLIESGRGRIVRIVDGQTREVVVGLPMEEASPKATPVGLLFLDPQTLLVACAGTDSEERGLYAIRVPAADAPAVNWNDVPRLQPPWEGGDRPPAVWPSLVAVTRQFVLASADDPTNSSAGYLARLEVKNDVSSQNSDSLGPVQRWISVPRPQCVTISPRGEIVVGSGAKSSDRSSDAASSQSSEASTNSGRVAVYRVTDQRLLLELPLTLTRLTGLIYSTVGSTADAPLLFAIDQGSSSESPTEQADAGGLYRLDATLKDRMPSLAAVKMIGLEHPTSIVRGVDQSLLITTLGPRDSQGQHPAGQLIEIFYVP